jgi:hypothetical protein
MKPIDSYKFIITKPNLRHLEFIVIKDAKELEKRDT